MMSMTRDESRYAPVVIDFKSTSAVSHHGLRIGCQLLVGEQNSANCAELAQDVGHLGVRNVANFAALALHQRLITLRVR